MKKNKTLVIVESPAKIKTISKYLGPDYIIRASYGHICELANGGTKGIGVNLETFKLRFQLLKDKKDKLQSIIDACSDVGVILTCTDMDREGEGISADIARYLKSTNIPIKRVTFSEITKKGIEEGMKNIRELDQNLADAQNARRALDRIVGYLVSPYLINTLGPGLSAGRVQSCCVNIVVQREKEILNFIPEEYWTIQAVVAKPDSLNDIFAIKYVNKITEGTVANKIKSDLETDTFIISDLEEKEKKRNPLPSLITVSLQTTAAGRYKFSADRTMKAAQKLYESGLITYMRTDSLRISDDALIECREWLVKHDHEIPAKANVYSPKEGAQNAHEAIRPTDICKLPHNIYVTEDEKKVYQLIWDRFVASQMKPALYDTVNVTVKSSSGHVLKTNGRILKYKGWLEISQDFENDDDDSDIKLPILKKGDNLILVPPKVKAQQKFTQPPPRFSEKTLIKDLEKRGIGRPSTYASIMAKITSRSYVVKKGEMFVATETGMKIIDALSGHFNFVEYKYTAEMEEQLDKVADGSLSYFDMMQAFYNPFALQLKKAYTANQKDYGFKCDACNEKMALKHGIFGFYMACANYPICRNTFSCEIIDEKPVRTEKSKELVDGVSCPKCDGGMIKKDGKFGPFYCCIVPSCHGNRKIPYGKKCSDCSGSLYATVYNSENVLFCMNYPKCFHKEKLETTLNIPENILEKQLPMPKVIKKVLKAVKVKKVEIAKANKI